MSSYDDRRRRERSRDREERDRDRDGDLDRGRRGQGRDRRSRSRSPRRNDQSRRGGRDYGRDRHDDRRESGLNRDRDRRDDRRRDDRRDSNRDRDYDSRRKDDERRLNELSPHSSRNEHDFRRQADEKIQKEISHVPINVSPTNGELEKFFPDTTKEEGEDDDETMEIENEGENAMMSMMGFGGFDSTKGKPVTGNQDGGANVKKPRTWRQYMNRRGGFNRPLDKIK